MTHPGRPESDTKEHEFLLSALTRSNPLVPSERIPAWLAERREAQRIRVEQIPFAELRGWSFDPATGNLVHASGRFFSIEGVHVRTNFGAKHEWSQPIINQPEVGVLGILAKKFDGILHFLMQAKMEPGNLNLVQLAPTLQATRSNYTRVHGGRMPEYSGHFLDRRDGRVLFDSLQSEQGARFLRKRNRNIIVETTRDVAPSDNFCWITLGQILELIQDHDNIVNMDARTVLSCIPWPSHSIPELAKILPQLRGPDQDLVRAEAPFLSAQLAALDDEAGLQSTDDVLTWFTELKFRYSLDIDRIPLRSVQDWYRDDRKIAHCEGKYFTVIAVSVESESREIHAWTQTMVKPCQEGIIAYVTKQIGGATHLLVQAKVEPGNFDVIEMAPTVQCITGSYRDEPKVRPPFVDYVLGATPSQLRSSNRQSEEGGRFFREANWNLLVEADEAFPIEVPANYMWLTRSQLRGFIKYNNHVNVQGRCLLSLFNLFPPRRRRQP